MSEKALFTRGEVFCTGVRKGVAEQKQLGRSLPRELLFLRLA